MAIASLLFSSSSRTVNFTLHPAMLHCRLAPSAVAKLAEGAEVVVHVYQLVHGAKIEKVLKLRSGVELEVPTKSEGTEGNRLEALYHKKKTSRIF